MPTEIITSLISAALGALLGHWLERRKSDAEIEKLKAETEKIKVETTKLIQDSDLKLEENEPPIAKKNSRIYQVAELLMALTTLFVPHLIIIWYFMYRVAQDYASVMYQPEFFFPVVIWSTLFITLYSLLWGIWIYPKVLQPWIHRSNYRSVGTNLSSNKPTPGSKED